MAYNEGPWDRDYHRPALDPIYTGTGRDKNPYSRMVELQLGSVIFPMPEPISKTTKVAIDMVGGGFDIAVAWPGPQVNANIAGLPIGVSAMIHGLHQAPLPGQEVLVGFVGGDVSNPIVIQSYPYNATQRLDLDIMHTLPLTSHAIGPTDIALGHHTGSFLAFRGTLPLPGQVDLLATTALTLTAGATLLETIGGATSRIAGGSYSVSSGGLLSLSAGAAMSVIAAGSMTLSAANIIIPPSTVTVTIGTGLEPMIKGATTLIEHTKLTALLTALYNTIQGTPIPTGALGAPDTLQIALKAATVATPVPIYTAGILSTVILGS